MGVSLSIPPAAYGDLLGHLLPPRPEAEEAAFLFARRDPTDSGPWAVFEQYLVPPREFELRTMGHLWLIDEVYGRMIKRAHDLEAALVEAHSHPYGYDSAACFSASDRAGLRDFAPHVRWRLPGRPFISLVFAASVFDGLVWEGGGTDPRPLAGIEVGGRSLAPTGLSLPAWSEA